jgi:16S rRNA (cytosine1402-N4)-methyltransferase
MTALQQAVYDFHLPVLLKEASDFIVYDERGWYIDGTLGGGGHAAEILGRLKQGGNLFAFDKDEEAINHCRLKFRDDIEKETGRLTLISSSYSKACSTNEFSGKINGILLDLGVSSRQLDESSRGFSYRSDSPLDLRFSTTTAQTASDLINLLSETELINILKKYGEEPFSRIIAKNIIKLRKFKKISTTFDLKQVISESVPFNMQNKSLSRVFQALRIAVNNELDELFTFLSASDKLLCKNGRIAVISYHSLEDRMVKTIFKEKSTQSDAVYKIITKKPIIPSIDEISTNLRARSAKMRVAEKL